MSLIFWGEDRNKNKINGAAAKRHSSLSKHFPVGEEKGEETFCRGKHQIDLTNGSERERGAGAH